MDVVGLVASLVLGALFLLAGASKIAAGDAWPAQARGLGAPRVVVPVVPWLEIGLGALLASQAAPRPAAVAALVVLVAFTVLVVARLAAGQRPPCACFGAWSARPIGAGHVARNVTMIGLAVVVLLVG